MTTPLTKLQKSMIEKNIAYYLIPSEDPHQSEYVDAHYKCRQFISGFTGSSGAVLAEQTESRLWTDGRYFTQAEAQIDSEQMKLMKMGVAGVPTILEYLTEHLSEGDVLGLNGRMINTSYGKKLARLAASKKAVLETDHTLAEDLWTGRPVAAASPIFIHEDIYAGESVPSKLKRIRSCMETVSAEAHFIASLPDIAWIFNLRGNDMPCTPLFYSYAWITQENCCLFVRETCLSEEVSRRLEQDKITILPYGQIDSFLAKQKGSVLIDPDTVNYKLCQELEKNQIIFGENPYSGMKAVKNETQISGLKECHLSDGIAMTKFMFWLKQNIGSVPMTERSVQDRLEEERRKQPLYQGPSFDTICAYKDHAAMMHYCSTEQSDVCLKPEGLLLIDSGGQYLTGTTDVTRTFILGDISEEERRHFTLVLKSMLSLSDAKFLLGCRGSSLDILARGPLWEEGIDYRCGTGHGVGHFLGVHEGPNAFRWQVRDNQLDAVLMPGMVTTDEPGVYIPGKYGIRTENMLLCRKQRQNEYGSFLEFEHLTLVPIDMDGVDEALLNDKEIRLLYAYHQLVFDSLSPHLTDEEAGWLYHFLRIQNS